MLFEKVSPQCFLLAVTKAVKFAIDPPLVNIPPPFLGGNLNNFKSQFIVIISSSVAAEEAAHPPENILNPVAKVSAMTLT